MNVKLMAFALVSTLSLNCLAMHAPAQHGIALSDAIKRGDVQAVLTALNNGAPINNVPEIGVYPARSALAIAATSARHNRIAIMNLLMQRGANIADVQHLLMHAVADSDLQMVRWLRAHGAQHAEARAYAIELRDAEFDPQKRSILDEIVNQL